MVAFGIAQAAVLLVGAWLVTRTEPGGPPTAQTGVALNPPAGKPQATVTPTVEVPAPAPAAAPVVVTAKEGAEIDIDFGSLVMIHSGPKGLKVVSRATDGDSSAVAALEDGPIDGNFVMLNILEAMAE
jgi:hypothetical protein